MEIPDLLPVRRTYHAASWLVTTLRWTGALLLTLACAGWTVSVRHERMMQTAVVTTLAVAGASAWLGSWLALRDRIIVTRESITRRRGRGRCSIAWLDAVGISEDLVLVGAQRVRLVTVRSRKRIIRFSTHEEGPPPGGEARAERPLTVGCQLSPLNFLSLLEKVKTRVVGAVPATLQSELAQSQS